MKQEICCGAISAVWDDQAQTVALQLPDTDGVPVAVATLSVHTAVNRLQPHADDPLCYDTVEDIDTRTIDACWDSVHQTLLVRCESTAWMEKQYRFRFAEDGIFADVTVRGEGRVGQICFFGGKHPGDMLGCSDYEFSDYFVPISDFFSAEHRYYNSIESFHSYFDLFVPPLYIFSFHTPLVPQVLGMGLCGRQGDWNFIQYDYTLRSSRSRKGFFLSTDFEIVRGRRW